MIDADLSRVDLGDVDSQFSKVRCRQFVDPSLGQGNLIPLTRSHRRTGGISRIGPLLGPYRKWGERGQNHHQEKSYQSYFGVHILIYYLKATKIRLFYCNLDKMGHKKVFFPKFATD